MSRAFRQHLLGVLAVMLLVGLVVVWQINEHATHEAEAAAESKVRAAAMGLALPLTAEDIAGGRAWADPLTTMIAPRLESGEIVAVHIWRRIDRENGEILWSTDAEKQGREVPLGGAAEALDTGEAVVDRLHDGRQSEGPPMPNLYEVYQPFADRTGVEYVLEVYKPVLEYDAIRARLIRDWLIISVLGVLVLGVVTLPLSLRLARAVGAAERERALYADRALRARAEEHRRIAEVLHERTVQDLAAIRLTLEAVRDLPAADEVGRALDRTTDLLDLDVHELRTLLTGGEGTEWQADDLATALGGWVSALPSPELVEIDLPDASLSLADADVALVFRVVKEAVRNAVKHAHASSVRVRVRVVETGEGDRLVAEVTDDGVGIDEAAPPGLGLRIIRHATAAAGGQVELASRTGAGTSLRLVLHRAS